MTIRELVDRAYDNATKKGFHDKEQSVAEMLMLIVSELGEALEAHRTGKVLNSLEFSQINGIVIEDIYSSKEGFEKYIKDTFEDELADVVIRIADMCGYLGIDLERHIKLKMVYNGTRERLHGKAY